MTKKISISHLVGNTPIIDVSYLSKQSGVKIYAKDESVNPSLSFKDRMASYIFEKLERSGTIKKGDTIVCASSGNTGSSVSMICALKGYKAIIVTSYRCSQEKRAHIKSLGADLVVISEGRDYIKEARKIAMDKGCYNLDQYSNLSNPDSYYETLGPEIWDDLGNIITHFVMTGSSGGCISGVSKYLKEKNEKIKTVFADPVQSRIYDYFYNIDQLSMSEHSKIDGAGKNARPRCLDFSIIDEVVKVSDDDAISMCKKFADQTGILIGGSSGLNLCAAINISKTCASNSVILTLICDCGIKYLSTIFSQRVTESMLNKASI